MTDLLHQYDYYIRLVLGRKRLFAAVALSIMGAGVILAYSLPKKYEADSTVFLEQNVITDLVKGIAVTPSVDAKLKMLSVALLSRTMLRTVVNELNKDLALKDDRAMEVYLSNLTSRITISFKEKQGVFRITLRDKDPIYARDFVNTLTRKYIDGNTSSKRDESLDATKFLSEQIEQLKRRIDAAEDAINKYKSEKGYILATDDVFLRGEIMKAEQKLEELAIKRNELESKKRVLQERGSDLGKLSAAEARLHELLGRYTEENPKVQRARAEVASLRAGGGDRAGHRQEAATLESLRMLQVEIDACKEMEVRQNKILDESKDMLREIPNVKSHLAELTRKKEDEAVVYQQLVSRYGQSEISKQMELQDKSMTFRILDPAVTPIIPVSPKRPLIILGFIGLGIGAGIGTIVLLDKMKGGIKSPSELKDLAIPVFAVVPFVQDVEFTAKTRHKDRVFLGFAAGCFLVILIFASADTFRLFERYAQAKSLVADTISHLAK